MKPRLCCTAPLCVAAAAVHARAKTVLPDACGDDKVTFDVKTEKDQPAPAPPADGKAQIVFIETQDKTWGCLGCGTPATRFGMDGAWVGANHGDSYFTRRQSRRASIISVLRWQSVLRTDQARCVGMASLTAEAGKVYYFDSAIGDGYTRA